jgi:ubiquinone/menaquinone biosynthesis C-methylase UbiE
MLPQVDYDDRIYAEYAAGRALTRRTASTWLSAFARNAPSQRPLTVLDLGCGIGRFTPLLAETFGGLTYGIDPAERMLAVARVSNPHPRVRYVAGKAERIPLADRTCDLVLVFLAFHHVAHRAVAAREIARVLRPGGRLLLQSSFSGQLEDRLWFHYFPRARQVEDKLFPALPDVLTVFSAAGLTLIGDERLECELAPSLAAYAEKLHHRAIPTFEYLTEREIAEGFAALAADVAAERPERPVVVRESAALLTFGAAEG